MLGELRTDADIFTPGQIFAFSATCYIADSAGHLELVETFAAGQIVHFGNLEFIADSLGELVLHGQPPGRSQERPTVFFNTPTSHIIANIDTVHDVLEEPGDTKELEDLNE
jgi:hypothetical protein